MTGVGLGAVDVEPGVRVAGPGRAAAHRVGVLGAGIGPAGLADAGVGRRRRA